MHILHTFDFLSLPHGGGTTDIIHRLSKAQARKGHDVTVYTGDYELDKNCAESLLSEGVEMVVSRSWFNRHGFYIIPSVVEFDLSEYDVIHMHCYRSFQNAVLSRKARADGIPYIIDAHGSTVRADVAKRALHTLYDRLFGYSSLHHASRLIAETEVGAREYMALGADPYKVRLLHPLIDTDEFSNLPPRGLFRKRHNIHEGFVVLFLGRIHYIKGIDILIQAFHRLSRVHDTRLVIAGRDDGFLVKLTRLVSDLDLSRRVSFVGFLDGYQKLSALVDADVLVQSSRSEAGARPALEAILCRTPVVVTRDTGAGREIAEFDGGYLSSSDPRDMANVLDYVLSHQGEALDRTRQARDYVISNLSLGRQLERYDRLYQEVVA